MADGQARRRRLRRFENTREQFFAPLENDLPRQAKIVEERGETG